MPENSDFYPQVMQRYVSEPSLPGNQMEFISTLLRVFEEKIFSATDFEPYPIEIIVDYIQRTHIYIILKRSSPRSNKASGCFPITTIPNTPSLTALHNFFHRYVNDLSEHIRAEEAILLPYIKTLREAGKTPAHFSAFIVARRDYSIDRFLNEHHDTEDELKDIRQTIRLYDPPRTNESLYRILLSQLQAFEQDLFIHAHIEEEVLIPKALALEKESQRPTSLSLTFQLNLSAQTPHLSIDRHKCHQRLIAQHIFFFYSILNLSIGLATAAFTPLKLTVATAITSTMSPAAANIHHDSEI